MPGLHFLCANADSVSHMNDACDASLAGCHTGQKSVIPPDSENALVDVQRGLIQCSYPGMSSLPTLGCSGREGLVAGRGLGGAQPPPTRVELLTLKPFKSNLKAFLSFQ